MKSLFLSHQHSLAAGGGGQQQCTREYRDALLAAGFDLVDATFDTDRSWKTRLKRKFFPAPYSKLIPEEFFSRLNESVREERPAFVFCNLYNFISWGRRLRKELPSETKLVLLSHGLASVDEIHAARIARQHPLGLRQISDQWIGAMLRVESEGLPEFNHVFCLASFEVEICRWLGARSVSWLPRTMRTDQVLKWDPTGDRVGIIGTIDHPPNLEGAELFCAAVQAAGPGKLRLRLVTRSREAAARLQSRYKFVDHVGTLEAPGAAEAELASWSAFVHPIFCYAMGCSTKVAAGFGWGLPVLTTASGLRGYTWKEGQIPVSNTPARLAASALAMLDPVRAKALREEVIKAVRSAPTLTDVAAQVRRDLGLV